MAGSISYLTVVFGILALSGCSQDAIKTTSATEPPGVTPQLERPAQPNFILITADTMRADAASVYGGPAKTPHLKELAQEGWIFERCISPSMLTSPAHASMFTALYPKDHGVYDNQSGISDELPTLTRELQRAGYATAAVIGFPHMNPNVSNLGLGFDQLIEATREERSASETVEAGFELLAKLPQDKPFFLWLHMVDPHSPYEGHDVPTPTSGLLAQPVPMAEAEKLAPNFQKTNKWFKKVFAELDSTRPLLERYNAEVEKVDQGIQALREGLTKRGMAEATALVFTSDHGENLGKHDLYFHHGSLYAETLHVPLLIHVPWKKPARINGWTQTLDIAPTVLALADLPMWQPHRGINLLDVVEGRKPARQEAFSEHLFAQLASVRSDSGTLITHLKSTGQFPAYPIVAGNQEFYQAEDTPKELKPLSPKSSAAKELHRALDHFLLNSLKSAPRPAAEQDMASLKSLGYIE